jgi:hypothetical protein
MIERGERWSPSRAVGVSFILLVLILSGILFYDGGVEKAEAVQPISVTLDFQTDSRYRTGNLVEIQTGPGETGQVSIDGNVTIYRSAKLARTKVFFTLYFKSDNPEVTGSIFPKVWEFEPVFKLQAIPIKVNLQVSPMTRFSSSVNSLVEVTVWGDWQVQYQGSGVGPFASGDIPEYPLFVNVRPYHYLQMTFDPVMLELSPGSSGWINCIVLNTGNGYERVELAIPGTLAYAKSGWVFEFEQSFLDIGPGSQASTKIKVTAPRKVQLKFHMTMYDFPVIATSFYSEYQVKDGIELEPLDYQMGFMVYVFGVDFVYVPWMWAIVIYIVLGIILLNLGVNIFTMKKRKLPKGKDPGFIALYHIISNPERRARARARMAERRKLRMAEKEKRALEKESLKKARRLDDKEREVGSPQRSRPLLGSSEPVKKRAPVLDLKPKDDDFDIQLPAEKERAAVESKPSRPLFGKPKKREKIEQDMIDVLSSLDD